MRYEDMIPFRDFIGSCVIKNIIWLRNVQTLTTVTWVMSILMTSGETFETCFFSLSIFVAVSSSSRFTFVPEKPVD